MRDHDPDRPESNESAIPQPRTIVSPIHRHSAEDGDDYGCCDDEENAQVAELVNELIDQIESGGFHDGEALIAAMRRGLESIGDEATDTIVKENVRNALREAVESSGLEVNWRGIYGW